MIAWFRRQRVVQLGIAKLGQTVCRHAYGLIVTRDRLYLRCSLCGRESVGFVLEERPLWRHLA